MVNENNVRVPITMSKDRFAFLDSAAKAYGISKSDLVNVALTEYFNNHMNEIERKIRKWWFLK